MPKLKISLLLFLFGLSLRADDEMCEAISSGKLEIVIELIKKGADINAICIHDRTALIKASYVGQLEIVKELIRMGADVNFCGTCPNSALYAAEKGKHFLIMKEL